MTEDKARDEIAFIRTVIEDGRNYLMGRSLGFIVWGVAIAIMYLGIYARVRGWWDINPNIFWPICIGLPWLYSLSRMFRPRPAIPPTARAMGMLWIGCGVTLTTLAIILTYSGQMRGEFAAVVAGIMGIGFFATSFLCNLTWMRWVAAGWWLGEFATYALRDRAEGLLVAAALMLLLLALPGIALQRNRPTLASA